MSDRSTVLIVDDDKADRLAIRHVLRHAPFEIDLIEAATVAESLEHLERGGIDCVISDNRLAAEYGLDLLREIRRRESERGESAGIPVIILTGRGDEMVAVEAMKAGATDYVPKSDLTTDRLASAIRTGVEIHGQRRQAAQAHAELQRAYDELEQRVRERTAELEHVNQELVQRSAEFDEALYFASHAFQDALCRVVAFSDAIREHASDDLAAASGADFDGMSRAVGRIRRLVQGLLSLARAGMNAVSREQVALAVCADKAVAALRGRMAAGGAEVIRDKLPSVLGDGMLLTQVYEHLLDNAIKYAAPDRPLRIRLTAEQTGDDWTLGVSDNGIGIKSEFTEQIFASFKRLRSNDTHDGVGIGLTVCRKIIERHGGQIWLESRPGEGAHIKFTLRASVPATQRELLPATHATRS